MCTPIVSALNMEQLFTCPYEPAHRIRRYKIRVHLQKCRKNHPCSDMKQCVYNVDHIVPAVEYDFHLETCEDRIKGDRYRWDIAPSDPNNDDNGPGPALVPLEAIPDIEIEDDWSISKRPVAVGSINAALQAQLKDKKVIIPKQGATKSERKAHYMEERMRHNGFEDLNKPSTSRPGVPLLDTSQPLRKPKTGSVIPAVSNPAPATSGNSSTSARALPKSALPAKLSVDYASKPTALPTQPTQPKAQPTQPKSWASVANENIKPQMTFPKGRGRAPGDSSSIVNLQEPKVGSKILAEKSKLNALAETFQQFGIDKDGFCNLPIPNKGRGRKLNVG